MEILRKSWKHCGNYENIEETQTQNDGNIERKTMEILWKLWKYWDNKKNIKKIKKSGKLLEI